MTTPNPIVDFENSEEFIVWGKKTLGRNPETHEQCEDFLTDLAELVKTDNLDQFKKLYEKYPLVRLGLRRSLVVLKQRGMIPEDFTWG